MAALVIAVWMLCGFLTIPLLLRALHRPMTEADEALARADRELDEIEAACRRRHASSWRAGEHL